MTGPAGLRDPLHIVAIRRRPRPRWRRYLLPGFRPSTYVTARPVSWNPMDGKGPVTVPAGFPFDGASVPPVLSWLFPRGHSDYLPAAMIHDWLYATDTGRTRREADAAFHRALRRLGVVAATAWPMWAAVRLGGWLYWRRPPRPLEFHHV